MLPSNSQPYIEAPLLTRPIIPKKHPILEGSYILPTEAISRMCDIVNQWIVNRNPGGIIHGRPRLGKTRAIRYLMDYLGDEDTGNYPVFLINCKTYRIPSEKHFFEDLLQDVGHALVYSGASNIKRSRLIQYLLDHAHKARKNRLVMIFDDAQRLQALQYDWLMDIYNELDRQGIFMTALLVGQDELLHQRSALKVANKEQIVGRFMVQSFRFSGVRDLDDLRTCLMGYDENSEFPESSGWSFTRYFFPEAFARGFRFEKYAEDLFNVFKEIKNKKGIASDGEIPMQYLTLAIEYCLREYGVDGANLNRLAKIQWREAITNSGYIESLK